MGLDTSHRCWHGAYSAFMRWREKLAELTGYPPLILMEGFYTKDNWNDVVKILRDKGHDWVAGLLAAGLPISWGLFNPDPLIILLRHSDCDGLIESKDCDPIADRLEELMPLLPKCEGVGHIGNWRDKTQAFIDGLREAARLGENVDFH